MNIYNFILGKFWNFKKTQNSFCFLKMVADVIIKMQDDSNRWHDTEWCSSYDIICRSTSLYSEIQNLIQVNTAYLPSVQHPAGHVHKPAIRPAVCLHRADVPHFPKNIRSQFSKTWGCGIKFYLNTEARNLEFDARI